jgi:hypothetical protein
MEIRLVNESAGVVGHVEIMYNTASRQWETSTYFGNAENGSIVQCPSSSSAYELGLRLVKEFEKECEDDFRKRYGEEPKGVMSKTGFTIQEVGELTA